MLKVAILDDYQNVSQEFVDLKKLSEKYEIKIFNEPFVDENDAIEKLSNFEALLIMRERTPITKNLIDNLKKLKFIITSGMRNKSIDFESAKKRKKYKISQISLLEVVIICGLIFLAPIYFIEMSMGKLIILEKPFYLTLAYVVIFPGLAAFFFWIKGISIIGANRAGIFLHLMPIFGAIMAMVIFDEKFMYYHFLGAIFIIAGITLSNKKKLNA